MKKWYTFLIIVLISHSMMGQVDRHSTTIQDAWLSCTARPNPNAARGTSHWILYDFKNIYALNKSTFWNFNTPTRLNHYRNMSWSLNLLQGSLEDGLKDIFIDISLDGVTWQEWGRFTLPKADGSGFYQGAAGPDFDGKIARFVLITPRNNYGGSCYGLGEVRINVTPATTSSIEDVETAQVFVSVSPNPAKDFIQVGLKGFQVGELSYALSDINGKVYKTGVWKVRSEWESKGINVHDIPTGHYVLSTQSDQLTKSVVFEVVR
ncbi:MAG: T9SS type A sorting domain-containing protein [Saprospiraceae bacterium]